MWRGGEEGGKDGEEERRERAAVVTKNVFNDKKHLKTTLMTKTMIGL